MSRLFCTIVVIVCIIQAAVLSLPLLSIDGFSWAENLVFDGNGSLFVSDYVKGEIKRIYLCSRASSNSNSDSPVDGDCSSRFGNSDDNYCVDIYASTGLKSVSGLVVSSDGRALYAGVILASNSAVAAAANSENGADEFALIRMPTDPALANGGYEIVLKTKLKPNGLAADWSTNTIYYTEEGSGTDDTGTLSAIHLPVEKEESAWEEALSNVVAADGCWFDTNSRLLFVGQLMSLKVTVFDLSEGFKLVGEFPALSSLGKGTNMLDDFTQDKIIVDQQDSVTEHEGRGIAKSNDYDNIALIGADWTGRSVMKFTLDGTVVQEIPLPQSVGELYEPTSVRWGSGYGFDSNSIYITEGGGFSGEESNRRVLQIPMYR